MIDVNSGIARELIFVIKECDEVPVTVLNPWFEVSDFVSDMRKLRSNGAGAVTKGEIYSSMRHILERADHSDLKNGGLPYSRMMHRRALRLLEKQIGVTDVYEVPANRQRRSKNL